EGQRAKATPEPKRKGTTPGAPASGDVATVTVGTVDGFELNEAANGERFVEQWKDDMLFNGEREKFLLWDGSCWVTAIAG
ncbi:hypothetical protein ACSTHG_23360, partial [Vibrio parahaemolyticus]